MESEMAIDRLLDTATAATVLGVSPATLRFWRIKGRGPRFIALSRGAIRYRLSGLNEYVSDHEVEPEKDVRKAGSRKSVKVVN
jgi:helix-turn-helix protein